MSLFLRFFSLFITRVYDLTYVRYILHIRIYVYLKRLVKLKVKRALHSRALNLRVSTQTCDRCVSAVTIYRRERRLGAAGKGERACIQCTRVGGKRRQLRAHLRLACGPSTGSPRSDSVLLPSSPSPPPSPSPSRDKRNKEQTSLDTHFRLQCG